jgi:hypothetical protein
MAGGGARLAGTAPRGAWVLLLACLAVVLGAHPAGAAAEGGQSAGRSAETRLWSFGIRWENDTISNHDRFYTNGTAFSLSHTGPSWADPVIDLLPWHDGRHTVSYSLSQAMFTPEKTDLVIPDPTDRPYAGVLAFGLGLHVDREQHYNGLKLVVGVVGPWSVAGETQREAHRILNNSVPRGWDSQLHNELVVNLAYEHRRKYRLLGRADGWAVEVVPVVGAAAGNLLTQGLFRGHLRIGYKIPDDFGGTLLRGMGELPPPRPLPDSARWSLGFYVQGSIGGNIVLHDITLDGNTVADSPSVDKRPFVPIAALGAGVGSRLFLATFSYVFAGEEFRGQRGSTQFGTLALNYFF